MKLRMYWLGFQNKKLKYWTRIKVAGPLWKSSKSRGIVWRNEKYLKKVGQWRHVYKGGEGKKNPEDLASRASHLSSSTVYLSLDSPNSSSLLQFQHWKSFRVSGWERWWLVQSKRALINLLGFLKGNWTFPNWKN